MTTKVLSGSEKMKKAGNFVLTGQETANADGFRNVSKKWFDKTISYEQGLEQLEAGRAITEDLLVPLHETQMVVKDNNFSVRFRDGRIFTPTEHALAQMGNWAEAGRFFPLSLAQRDDRDSRDADTLITVFNNGFRRLSQDKPFLWRVRHDGTLRAMLSDKYACVDNRWLIESIARIIPGGRLSHWRGDSDTIYGNVLIPDSIRTEDDSDYGGMLSTGNSEIGERKLTSLPSIFRAICQNGCIWGQKKGAGLNVVHRGKIDLDNLFEQIKENLLSQIPLMAEGVDRLLSTRHLLWKGDSLLPVFAQVAISNKLSKKQANGIADAYTVELMETPQYAHSLFAVINSITRAGQELSNENWVKFDTLGGTMTQWSEKEWSGFTNKAKSLSKEEVDAIFAA